jgi:hypothetical protein
MHGCPEKSGRILNLSLPRTTSSGQTGTNGGASSVSKAATRTTPTLTTSDTTTDVLSTLAGVSCLGGLSEGNIWCALGRF